MKQKYGGSREIEPVNISYLTSDLPLMSSSKLEVVEARAEEVENIRNKER